MTNMFISFEFFLADLLFFIPLIPLPSPSQTKIKTGLLHPSLTFKSHSSAFLSLSSAYTFLFLLSTIKRNVTVIWIISLRSPFPASCLIVKQALWKFKKIALFQESGHRWRFCVLRNAQDLDGSGRNYILQNTKPHDKLSFHMFIIQCNQCDANIPTQISR